jgi:hypothetical protein
MDEAEAAKETSKSTIRSKYFILNIGLLHILKDYST